MPLVLFLCGCGYAKPTAPSHMTTFGSHHDPVTGWTVRIDQTNHLEIGPRTTSKAFGILKIDSTVSPSDWKADPGWFVFAETAERVWVFDGENELIMLKATPEMLGSMFHRSKAGSRLTSSPGYRNQAGNNCTNMNDSSSKPRANAFPQWGEAAD